jgi:short-subunit dehydrogenase
LNPFLLVIYNPKLIIRHIPRPQIHSIATQRTTQQAQPMNASTNSSAKLWNGKHVLITGASSGLGRALAMAAASAGARVGLVARREGLLQELAAELATQGASAAHAVADVGDWTQVNAAVGALEERLGPVDVAIANAGIYRITDGAAYDAERAAQVISTNLLGTSHLLGAVLPGMVRRQAGHMCAVSSLAALVALPGGGAYCASKMALGVLLKSVRLDVERSGLRVTVAYPGYIDTPMITERERRTLRGLFTAHDAAQRILRAIEHGKREVYFPRRLRFECRVANWLPWPIYRAVMGRLPPMEET